MRRKEEHSQTGKYRTPDIYIFFSTQDSSLLYSYVQVSHKLLKIHSCFKNHPSVNVGKAF